MTAKSERKKSSESDERPPLKVRLPGFVADEDIGLGDVVQRATSYLGIKPCGGCKERAARLNRMFTFTGRGR